MIFITTGKPEQAERLYQKIAEKRIDERYLFPLI